MLITQPALLYLRAMFGLLGHAIAMNDGRPKREVDAFTSRRSPLLLPIPHLVEPAKLTLSEERTPIHGSSAPSKTQLDGPLTVRERRARAAALRALALSRTRRFSGARDAFIEASRLDPQLDLTRVPMFWALERAAHEAAIDAYLATGREDEATVLRAQVRTTFRPRSFSRQSAPSAVST